MVRRMLHTSEMGVVVLNTAYVRYLHAAGIGNFPT